MWRAQGNVVTRGEGLQIPLKKLPEFEAELYKSLGRNPGRKQMRKEALMNGNNVLQSL